MGRLWRRRQVAGLLLRRVCVKHLVLVVRIVSQELARPCVYRVICSSTDRVASCEDRKCKKMVFPAAIRKKSQRWVALSCDAHLMFASSGRIRQPCTFSLSDPVSCGTVLISQHFCTGNLSCRCFCTTGFERCLLITKSPKTPGHYRYLIWVLGFRNQHLNSLLAVRRCT